jgi:hypothetical protein
MKRIVTANSAQAASVRRADDCAGTVSELHTWSRLSRDICKAYDSVPGVSVMASSRQPDRLICDHRFGLASAAGITPCG